MRRHCNQHIKPGEYNCLHTTFELFEMLLTEACNENPDDYGKFLQIYFQAAIIYSLIWGVAGVLDASSREKFDNFLREVISFLIIQDFFFIFIF